MSRTRIDFRELLFLIIVSLFWFAQYVYVPYQTVFLTSQGVTVSFVGIIIGAYGLSQLILKIPLGYHADISNKNHLFIIIGTLLSGMASSIRILIPNKEGFLVANILSGVASCTWISFMVMYSNNYHVGNAKKANSKIILFNNIGMLIAFVVSTLFYKKIGMKYISLLSLISGFLSCVLSFFIIDRNAKSKINNNPLKILKIIFNKKLIIFSLVALVQQGIQVSTTMSFTSEILRKLGAEQELIGLSIIIYMLSSVIFSRLSYSKLFLRKHNEFWIPLVLVIVFFYCITIPNISSVPIILLLQILPGLSTGILFSYSTSEAMTSVSSQEKTTAMGFFQAIYAIGMTFFPLMTGYLAKIQGMKSSFFCLGIISFISSILIKTYYHKTKQFRKTFFYNKTTEI